jgi:hypothetical protein
VGVDGLVFWLDMLKNTFIVILILTIILVAFYVINHNYIEKTEDKLSGDKYVAVVLTNKSPSDKIMVYLSGVMFLVMYLKKNEKPYKLMKKFGNYSAHLLFRLTHLVSSVPKLKYPLIHYL